MSITVSANIDPTLCYEWLEICKRNVGSTTLPLYEQSQGELQPNHLGKLLNEVSLIHKVSESMAVLMRGMLTHFAGLVRKEIPNSEVERQKSIGAKLKNAVREASKASSFEGTSVKLSPRVDYSYVQDKVNVYRSGNDGYAPVTRLVVMRKSFRQNGEDSMYPWTVKITNGEAVMKERSNGATTFQADTLRNKKEVYINLSDRDVFRMMIRVTRFIEVWETAYCIPIINAGQQMRADRSH